MSSLAERLASIRENANTSPRSETIEATPLRTFLFLYTKANTECYEEYMEGAKALYKYLAPLYFPYIPAIYNIDCPVPSLLRGYESLELAKVITPRLPEDSLEVYLAKLSLADRAIMFSMFIEVLPELY